MEDKGELLEKVALLEQELLIMRQANDPLTDSRELVGKIEALQKELDVQKAFMKTLQMEYKKKVDELANLRTKFNIAKRNLEKKENTKIPVAKEHEIVHKYLKDFMTEAQIEYVFRKTPAQRSRSWGQEDYEFATQLYKLSSNAYEFLRAENKLPLPSLKNVRKWKSDQNYQKEVKERDQLRKQRKEASADKHDKQPGKPVKPVKRKIAKIIADVHEAYKRDLPECSKCRTIFSTEDDLRIHSRSCVKESQSQTIVKAENVEEFSLAHVVANQILNKEAQANPLIRQIQVTTKPSSLDASVTNQNLNLVEGELTEIKMELDP